MSTQKNTDSSRSEEMSEKDQKEEKQTKENKNDHHHSVNLAIIGGVVGAGVGLFANPETSKRAIRNLGESEFVKMAGEEFKKTAQEVLARQAQTTIRQLAAGYIDETTQELPVSKKETNGSEDYSSDAKYEEIKNENKNLNERLERIEKMLTNLVNSK
ncbi:GvpT/GvpP family gas vesicle accessory protein [Bacillus sp. FJAT-27231]|uniref:GvpT/GvpP family gas vesicle accessory protein n=1 Tax=Bacillus sp. FJAT-27231 TaxID=1679168 RepID=UPI000670ECAB|nr:GvpT/GvpP family gas vesicle accessory protein [Bacillus sp. FJAT-27231]